MESFRDPQEVQLGAGQGHQTKAQGSSVQPGRCPWKCSEEPAARQEVARRP